MAYCPKVDWTHLWASSYLIRNCRWSHVIDRQFRRDLICDLFHAVTAIQSIVPSCQTELVLILVDRVTQLGYFFNGASDVLLRIRLDFDSCFFKFWKSTQVMHNSKLLNWSLLYSQPIGSPWRCNFSNVPVGRSDRVTLDLRTISYFYVCPVEWLPVTCQHVRLIGFAFFELQT